MTNIGLTDDERRLTLVAMNVDAARTNQKRNGVILRNRNLNADVSCILATHDAITSKTQLGEYIIYQWQAKDNVNDENPPNYTRKHES